MSEIIEPPLPADYLKFRQYLQALASMLFVASMLPLSFLAEELTSLNVSYQTFVLTMTVEMWIIHSKFAKYIKYRSSEITKLFSVLFLTLGIAQLVDWPILTLTAFGVNIISLLINLIFMLDQPNRIERILYVYSVCIVGLYFRFNIGPIFFKMSQIPLIIYPALILVIYQILFCLSWPSIISNYQYQQDLQYSPFKISGLFYYQRIIFRTSPLILWSTFASTALKFFVPQSFYLIILSSNTILCISLGLLYFIFGKEILLEMLPPQTDFYQNEKFLRKIRFRQITGLLFRYHHPRSFQNTIYRRQQHIEECLLCDSPAEIVNFSCGHLTLCQKCQIKNMQYPYCMMCRSYIYYFNKISAIQDNLGYRGKWLVKKSIRPNYYISETFG